VSSPPEPNPAPTPPAPPTPPEPAPTPPAPPAPDDDIIADRAELARLREENASLKAPPPKKTAPAPPKKTAPAPATPPPATPPVAKGKRRRRVSSLLGDHYDDE
jgi:hypothetical protein